MNFKFFINYIFTGLPSVYPLFVSVYTFTWLLFLYLKVNCLRASTNPAPKPINSVNFSLYLANFLWLQLQIETVISWVFLLSNRRPVFGLLAIMKHGFVQFFERKYTKRPVLSLASLSSARKGAELIIVLINNFDKHGSWSQRGTCFGIYWLHITAISLTIGQG